MAEWPKWVDQSFDWVKEHPVLTMIIGVIHFVMGLDMYNVATGVLDNVVAGVAVLSGMSFLSAGVHALFTR